MQAIVILIIRMITLPTGATTMGIITLLDVGSKAVVMGVGSVPLVVMILLHSSMKSVSVPGKVQLNFAVSRKGNFGLLQ